MFLNDTIASIATAMTNSGIGIIRVSGPESIAIVDKIFVAKNKNKKLADCSTYTAHYGFVYDDEEMVDECVVLLMKAPNSYTKEDVVEIDCHGGVMVMKKVLELVIRNGARPAEPGEFTKRAFLNGRIDLSQAESVMDIIHSKNEFALKSSLKQLRGSLKEEITGLRKNILHEIAFIESALDDPEHISLDGYADSLKLVVSEELKRIGKMLESTDNGRILKEGIKTAIIGKPNAGKSTLLNSILGEERAIVTEIAGTTRDTLEEAVSIHGIPLNIIDTAGIRSTEDVVEKIGVNKAKEMAKDADLVLYVIDASKELNEDDKNIMELLKEKRVIALMNKMDLDTVVSKEDIRAFSEMAVVEISAKNHDGMQELYDLLKDMFFDGNLSFNDEIYITNMRHKTALLHAKDNLLQVLNSIENEMPEDFYSIDLMAAYEELGYIIGESLGEDLVNEIFSSFCMGK